MLATFLVRVKSWAFTALAVAAVLVGAYAYGGRRARAAAELEQRAARAASDRAVTNEIVNALERKNEITEEVAKLPPGAALSELREHWSR